MVSILDAGIATEKRKVGLVGKKEGNIDYQVDPRVFAIEVVLSMVFGFVFVLVFELGWEFVIGVVHDQ